MGKERHAALETNKESMLPDSETCIAQRSIFYLLFRSLSTVFISALFNKNGILTERWNYIGTQS